MKACCFALAAILFLPAPGRVCGQEATQAPASSPPGPGPVHAAKITVLSTMMTDRLGLAEWGFSALVEVAGRRVLFDTGGRPDTVLRNARELGVDLSGVEDVVLSHDHWDHPMGLVTLRRELMKTNPRALGCAHVARGIFLERVFPPGWGSGEPLTMAQIKADYEALGGTFIESDQPEELLPGVWLTGPVPRPYPEKNWSPGVRLRNPAGLGLIEDTIPEDQALVLDTDQGLVVLTGCGHAGVVNLLEYARKVARPVPMHALLGGLHLYAAKEETLAWTADKLREFGVARVLGAHCTGLEAVYSLRARLGLEPGRCEVATVGTTFELGRGTTPAPSHGSRGLTLAALSGRKRDPVQVRATGSCRRSSKCSPPCAKGRPIHASKQGWSEGTNPLAGSHVA